MSSINITVYYCMFRQAGKLIKELWELLSATLNVQPRGHAVQVGQALWASGSERCCMLCFKCILVLLEARL